MNEMGTRGEDLGEGPNRQVRVEVQGVSGQEPRH